MNILSRSIIFLCVMIQGDNCNSYFTVVTYKEKAFCENPNNVLFLKPLGENYQMFGIVLEKNDSVLLFSSVEK